jgi:hypothetical protein
MLGGLLPTFVTLLSPDVADIPGRLTVFIIGSVLVFLLAVAASPETRGALERPAPVDTDPPTAVVPTDSRTPRG